MCGICGKLNFDESKRIVPEVLKSMADAIKHRGPDDEGYYYCGPLGLGFRRLAIIDLHTGHQPISNETGTTWIVFNGEIYNYRELRNELIGRGHRFNTNTDTEVIVHLYEEYGDTCAKHLRGMFAFAIWDELSRKLLLCRDRVGIKPLYYLHTSSGIVFGSEIKAILADPEVITAIQPEIVDRFLAVRYLPGEDTMFEGVKKLQPGTYMSIQHGITVTKQYWDLHFSCEPRSMQSAQDELLSLLEESVDLHMISDVPVGVLLSGGLDSTALLGLAANKSRHKLNTFTIGFGYAAFEDERPYARQAAERYGTDHHEMTIGAKEFADFLPTYVRHMEEPVCEPPAVALYYVTKLAKNFVKVLISGEGGDEAFAGYPNYRSIVWLERIKRLGVSFQQVLGSASEVFTKLSSDHRLSRCAAYFRYSFDDYYYSRTYDPCGIFNSVADEFYSNEFRGTVNRRRSLDPARRYLLASRGANVLNRMLYVDTKTWLPDDLLIKADKMSMANSVELRVPLLDHRLLEFAARLPTACKVHGFQTKHIVKRALKQRIPREILGRRKAGFPIPYDSWLRIELRDWLNEILLDRTTIARGYFRKAAIEGLLSENSRSGSYSKELFSLAVLELWHREFLKSERVAGASDVRGVSDRMIAKI